MRWTFAVPALTVAMLVTSNYGLQTVAENQSGLVQARKIPNGDVAALLDALSKHQSISWAWQSAGQAAAVVDLGAGSPELVMGGNDFALYRSTLSSSTPEHAVSPSGCGTVAGTGTNTGLIRRVWTRPRDFTRADAFIYLPVTGFTAIGPSAQHKDVGYTYFAGLGSECQSIEAGFLYSFENKWWTPYMRFDKSFKTGSSTNGYFLATIKCNTALLFCANGGNSKRSGWYHITFAQGALAVCVHSTCNGGPTFQTVFVFKAHPVEQDAGISIIARGPLTSRNNWNGWGTPCKCRLLRETNIAQEVLAANAAEYFGPIGWSDVGVDHQPWTLSMTAGCENWDGIRDQHGISACGASTRHITVTRYGAVCESDVINPAGNAVDSTRISWGFIGFGHCGNPY